MPTANINGAGLYYEIAGQGPPFIMIHAGVADSRQWDREFEAFQQQCRTLRYDLRGFGKSEPAAGQFRHIDDLTALLAQVGILEPAILMGCSMGGTLAMDFALAYPSRVAALIMVASGPSGLELDVPRPEKFEQAEAAWKKGDLDLVCELETQIWFDGVGRKPEDVDQHMRALMYDMNRLALDHETRNLGEQLPDADTPAADRLDELAAPVLVIVGNQDIPYMQGAADHMQAAIADCQRVDMEDAAHLPNLEHPEKFSNIVSSFLKGLQKRGRLN